MPTLNWIGKEKVTNHHLDVPYRVLDHQYGFEEGKTISKEIASGNKIIHGDNLEALKSLLPEYEGRIKCIYIDPPYNTGNEGWIYNDNVNDIKIRKWLGQTVGKEGDDLTRHDKWLCMMYPRVQLLYKLLSKDGIILSSIDDNEYQNLKYIFDETFGKKNLITNFTWKTDGNFDNQAKIKINHEYILCYAKDASLFPFPKMIDPNISSDSKLFNPEIKNTIVKNGLKNPKSEIVLPIGFPCNFENGIIRKRTNAWPHFLSNAIVDNYKLSNEVTIYSGWSSKGIFEEFIENNFKTVLDSKGQETTFILNRNGSIENIKGRSNTSHVVSSLFNMGSTQNMSSELKKMGLNFDYPKPVTLIEYLICLINDPNYTVLDSFSGSGTTAHAVLNLNKSDEGNRKFILIEMQDYADTITAERVKRVIKGYGDKEGTGGSFDYYTLGQPIFNEEGHLNETVGITRIRQYVFYTETKTPLANLSENAHSDLMGTYEGTAYYFYYDPDIPTTLDRGYLSAITEKADQYVIYADNCLLDPGFMLKHNIIFKKIPRDITRF